MNIGSAEDLLQSDLRNHVNRLKKNFDLSYIRFWNLFTKGMKSIQRLLRHITLKKSIAC